MTREERRFYQKLSRLCDYVGAAAETLSCGCKDGDGHRMTDPETVKSLLHAAMKTLNMHYNTHHAP